MSDVQAELKNIQGLMKASLQALVPILRKIHKDMPTGKL